MHDAIRSQQEADPKSLILSSLARRNQSHGELIANIRQAHKAEDYSVRLALQELLSTQEVIVIESGRLLALSE